MKVPKLQILTAAQRGRRRRSPYFEGPGQNLTRSVAAGAPAVGGDRVVIARPPEKRLRAATAGPNAGTGAGKGRPRRRKPALQGL
jgi:hypothetical protein